MAHALTRWCLALICMVGTQAGTLPDPMQPPAAVSKHADANVANPADVLVLQSVLLNGAKRIAVINGQHLKQGDQVNGYVVIAIRSGQAELSDGKSKLTLTVFSDIKRASNRHQAELIHRKGAQ
ncbi:hypothetical protein KSF73_11680 [Burkholderiaceae bacterium DAT-1]|nr:hypothetical protein [Burkholderiaceae bacterium DAT-1]